MNYAKRTLVYFIVHTAIGVIALLTLIFVQLPDNYREGMISGITGGFIVTGILGIIASIRLMKNPKKAMEAEMIKNEERTQFIRVKTSSAVYSVSLYIECICTLAAGILGFKEISMTLAVLLMIQIALYFGFANYYWKKY